jgi:putative Mn2+ efflux pump MntP
MDPAFAVLLAAAGVGFGHAALPDHWVPLAVVARTQRYSLRRTLRLSTAAAMTHVIVSLALGAILIMIGLQFRATVQHRQDIVVGGLLALTGVVFVVMELVGRRGGRGQGHGHGHEHESTTSSRTRRLAAVMIPFGAAASPDLTILPVFLAASAIGTAAAVGSVIAFAIVTAATIVGFTVTATIAGYQVRGGWIDKYANLITALVLLLIGILILAGVI